MGVSHEFSGIFRTHGRSKRYFCRFGRWSCFKSYIILYFPLQVGLQDFSPIISSVYKPNKTYASLVAIVLTTRRGIKVVFTSYSARM
eukprot:scaffold3642_cov47-Cylindrotheca_fusiformis.AAC.1